jgi:hypothetical protein
MYEATSAEKTKVKVKDTKGRERVLKLENLARIAISNLFDESPLIGDEYGEGRSFRLPKEEIISAFKPLITEERISEAKELEAYCKKYGRDIEVWIDNIGGLDIRLFAGDRDGPAYFALYLFDGGDEIYYGTLFELN